MKRKECVRNEDLLLPSRTLLQVETRRRRHQREAREVVSAWRQRLGVEALEDRIEVCGSSRSGLTVHATSWRASGAKTGRNWTRLDPVVATTSRPNDLRPQLCHPHVPGSACLGGVSHSQPSSSEVESCRRSWGRD